MKRVVRQLRKRLDVLLLPIMTEKKKTKKKEKGEQRINFEKIRAKKKEICS